MVQFVIKRLGQGIFSLLIVVLMVAFAMRLSGDPAVAMFQGSSAPTTADLARIRHALGTDRPFLVQYWEFLKGMAVGNLGISFRNNEPVSKLIAERLPATISLALVSLAFALLVAIPVGMYAAVFQNSILDQAIRIISMFGLSFPNFWIGIMLIMLFGVKLRWLPPSGFEGWRSLVLPGFTLALILSSFIVRLVRATMVEVFYEQYIVTARAKGLTEHIIQYKHGLRNGMIPIVTYVGLQFGGLLGGVVIIEQVFAWPGVGRLALEAISYRDYPLLQGTIAVLAVVIILVNLAVDISYALIDPRIRVK